MDADGNLTEIVEFTQARNFRLVSNLDSDCAIGVSLDAEGGGSAIVSRPSTDTPENSIFIGIGAGEYFVMQWFQQHDLYLCADQLEQQLYTQAFADLTPGLPVEPNAYTVTFVDGCWFNLVLGENNVVDCAGSNTSQGNPILSWEPNGGANQLWRAATTGPGL